MFSGSVSPAAHPSFLARFPLQAFLCLVVATENAVLDDVNTRQHGSGHDTAAAYADAAQQAGAAATVTKRRFMRSEELAILHGTGAGARGHHDREALVAAASSSGSSLHEGPLHYAGISRAHPRDELRDGEEDGVKLEAAAKAMADARQTGVVLDHYGLGHVVEIKSTEDLVARTGEAIASGAMPTYLQAEQRWQDIEDPPEDEHRLHNSKSAPMRKVLATLRSKMERLEALEKLESAVLEEQPAAVEAAGAEPTTGAVAAANTTTAAPAPANTTLAGPATPAAPAPAPLANASTAKSTAAPAAVGNKTAAAPAAAANATAALAPGPMAAAPLAAVPAADAVAAAPRVAANRTTANATRRAAGNSTANGTARTANATESNQTKGNARPAANGTVARAANSTARRPVNASNASSPGANSSNRTNRSNGTSKGSRSGGGDGSTTFSGTFSGTISGSPGRQASGARGGDDDTGNTASNKAPSPPPFVNQTVSVDHVSHVTVTNRTTIDTVVTTVTNNWTNTTKMTDVNGNPMQYPWAAGNGIPGAPGSPVISSGPAPAAVAAAAGAANATGSGSTPCSRTPAANLTRTNAKANATPASASGGFGRPDNVTAPTIAPGAYLPTNHPNHTDVNGNKIGSANYTAPVGPTPTAVGDPNYRGPPPPPGTPPGAIPQYQPNGTPIWPGQPGYVVNWVPGQPMPGYPPGYNPYAPPVNHPGYGTPGTPQYIPPGTNPYAQAAPTIPATLAPTLAPTPPPPTPPPPPPPVQTVTVTVTVTATTTTIPQPSPSPTPPPASPSPAPSARGLARAQAGGGGGTGVNGLPYNNGETTNTEETDESEPAWDLPDSESIPHPQVSEASVENAEGGSPTRSGGCPSLPILVGVSSLMVAVALH